MSISKHNIILILECLIALGLILALIWAFWPREVDSFEYEQEPKLFVQSRKMPPVETQTLASKANIDGLYAISTRRQRNDPELKYKTLIECLEWYESRGNPEAYNRYDPVTPSIGCLQFKRATWNHFDCTGSIWNCKDQKRCADKIISNDWSQVTNWSTHQQCLR